jgi:Zn-dependent protease with chaperone function
LKRRHWPLAFLFFAGLGVICLLAGIAAAAGLLAGLHPLFNDGLAAGLALIVSAVALILTAAFPLVLRRLAEREGA